MPGNAAIYLADPSLMGSKFFGTISGIRSCEGISRGDRATGVKFILDAGEVTMNFMPEERVPLHLEEFSAFAEQAVKDRDRLIYVLARICQVRLVCGCVITPDFDDAKAIEGFLFRFNQASNGLLFIAGTIFDYDGETLGGLSVGDSR